MKLLILSLVLLVLPATNLTLAAQPRRTNPIFVYNTDGFWINLHHFLYVLARAQNKESDATTVSVSEAPVEQERGLATVSDSEKRVWRKAVTDYAAGPARKNLTFDEPLAAITKSLGMAGDAKTLKGADPALSAILESAAPIYRKVWWKQHRDSNRRWQKAMQPLVNKHGPAVLGIITAAYKLDWPTAGYPIQVSAYGNWAGAYSTSGDLLVLSSQSPNNQGEYGLEILFHEAMHQWDTPVFELLRAEARKQGKRVPARLSHSLIFFTAGEAVRRVLPAHIPYAEKNGIWQGAMGAFKPAIEETWKPYLDGRGTREEAMFELIKRVGTAP